MESKRKTNTRGTIEKIGVDAVVSALKSSGTFALAARSLEVSTWGLRQFANRHGIKVETMCTVRYDIVMPAAPERER